MEDAQVDRLYKEVSSQLGRARALLALAHRTAIKMPLAPEDQTNSNTSLAEAIGFCVSATRSAKANNLYKLTDSGLNPSELRHSVERAMTKPVSSRPAMPPRRPLATPNDPVRLSLFAQLDACRRLNLEGLRWLNQPGASAEDTWRGKQLMKIAEQLCVVTALESKLFGAYVLGDSRDEPPAVRKAINFWATETTRKELAEE
jgi:hypothetical protein